MTAPFPMIERALVELLESGFGAPEGTVGGDLSYDASTDDYYLWIGLVSGSTDAIYGEWSVDIDVFDNKYGQAMDRALAIEAFLMKPGGHRTSIMLLDSASQNEVPIERPWGDDNAYRIGATYTFTARRSAGTIVMPTPVTGDVVGAFTGEGPPPVDLVADPGDQYLDELTGDLYTME